MNTSTQYTPQTQILADLMTYGLDATLTFDLPQQQGWTDEQLLKADRALQKAIHLARRSSWDLSEKALDRAYHVLGGENPGTGYDFYCGAHAIQWCAR